MDTYTYIMGNTMRKTRTGKIVDSALFYDTIAQLKIITENSKEFIACFSIIQFSPYLLGKPISI